MKKIAIIYGSSTGNTETIALNIAEKLSGEDIKLIEVSKLKASDLDEFSNLILGTSTWGLGELQDDWDVAISLLEKSNLNGKVIALYGLGDASSYSDTFVDGMGIIYDTIKDKGCNVIGETSTDGYQFDSSKAVVDGKFIGLALDEDTESNLTGARLDKWIANILPLFK
ncbi:MAG: flavodoxin [Bacteroidales bacterium]|jgi:flavodoxin I|nr:flavodoxin [Bacteroidales bacterium]